MGPCGKRTLSENCVVLPIATKRFFSVNVRGDLSPEPE
jgi:hypothetical protein